MSDGCNACGMTSLALKGISFGVGLFNEILLFGYVHDDSSLDRIYDPTCVYGDCFLNRIEYK